MKVRQVREVSHRRKEECYHLALCQLNRKTKYGESMDAGAPSRPGK